MKLYYIHGFNSYKGSSTPKKLRHVLGCDVIELYYRSEQCFEEIMRSLREQYISSHCEDGGVIVGTSMGGFFADQLSDMPGVQAVMLINPVVDPTEVLSQAIFLGEQENYITHERTIFTKETAMSYSSFRDMRNIEVKRYLLLSQKDELLDSSKAREYWGRISRIETIEGGHRLTDFGTVARLLNALIPEEEDPNERYAG